MEEIETLTTECRTLAELSNSFGPLNIHGWEMQDIYKKFPSLAIFCSKYVISLTFEMCQF